MYRSGLSTRVCQVPVLPDMRHNRLVQKLATDLLMSTTSGLTVGVSPSHHFQLADTSDEIPLHTYIYHMLGIIFQHFVHRTAR